MNCDYSDKNPALGALYAGHIETLTKRHDHALEKAGASHAVIYSGNPRIAFLDDYQMPFKANPHFVSWAPLIRLPFSYIVYTPGETPILIYFQPHDYWHVVPGAPDGYWTNQFDIRIVHTLDEVGMHLPIDREKCVVIGDIEDDALAFGIERVNPTTTLNILHYARGLKTEYELAVMRLASQRGVQGHIAAETAFRNGESEFDIHRAYCKAVSHTEPELPYGNIVALNEHGAVLHYTDFDRQPPAESRSFLIDAGAQVHGYASDITRTYSSGDERFQALIDRMLLMQQEIVSKVQTGVDYRELHVGTHKLLAAVLVDAELANGDPDTLLETGVTSAFFPHGLGHLGHPFLRLTRKLEENMVLTIEPGLYAIDMLLENLKGSPAESLVNWKTVDWLRPFGGIRLEDNVRVLSNSQENLTHDAFEDASK
jgi:Xaa-Pro dipeptidase